MQSASSLAPSSSTPSPSSHNDNNNLDAPTQSPNPSNTPNPTHPDPASADEQALLSTLRPSPSRTAPASSHPPGPAKRPSLLSILQDSVGKDLTRIALPVYFNEPLSFLQRLAEDVEYHTLLDDAAAAAPGVDRAALLAVFVASHYSSTAGRASKPFNPLLGETFELVVPGRVAIVAEQVAHHPPISALHARGLRWTYSTAQTIRSKFKGNSMDVWPEGAVHVRFADGEHYVYEQAKTTVNNIILGDLWLDNGGTITIEEVTKRKFAAVLKLKKSSFLFGEASTPGELSIRVHAVAADGSKGKTLRKLTGNWTSEIVENGRVLWKAAVWPEKRHTAGYPMTAWSWQLNAEPDGDDVNLPKTDSRLRPDQRALERGQHKLAAAEKDRLENEQRRRQKEAEAAGKDTAAPHWFSLQDTYGTGKKEWTYGNNYYRCKENGWPSALPDIF